MMGKEAAEAATKEMKTVKNGIKCEAREQNSNAEGGGKRKEGAEFFNCPCASQGQLKNIGVGE